MHNNTTHSRTAVRNGFFIVQKQESRGSPLPIPCKIALGAGVKIHYSFRSRCTQHLVSYKDTEKGEINTNQRMTENLKQNAFTLNLEGQMKS